MIVVEITYSCNILSDVFKSTCLLYLSPVPFCTWSPGWTTPQTLRCTRARCIKRPPALVCCPQQVKTSSIIFWFNILTCHFIIIINIIMVIVTVIIFIINIIIMAITTIAVIIIIIVSLLSSSSSSSHRHRHRHHHHHHHHHYRCHYHISGPFPSSPGPLFQNEGRCSAFDMEIIFHSHANNTYFHKKGCTPSLILKVRGLWNSEVAYFSEDFHDGIEKQSPLEL